MLAGEIGGAPRQTAIRQGRRGALQRSYPRANEDWLPWPSLKSGEARRDSLVVARGPERSLGSVLRTRLVPSAYERQRHRATLAVDEPLGGAGQRHGQRITVMNDLHKQDESLGRDSRVEQGAPATAGVAAARRK